MRSSNGLLAQLLATVSMASIASLGQALPTDRDQPIRITADSAVRNEQTGETRYEGSVELTQGSLHIEADLLTLHQYDNAADGLITATGAPATLEQTPQEGKAPIKATAHRIAYDQKGDKVTLTENARIEQDGAIVTGATIDYVLSQQRVTATSDQTTGQGSGQRVEMIIPPSAMERPKNPDS
ncbi:MAG: lipopolysaccharide transport periplasmic protein LptA [Luminiphilus sp.]|nr:lipopolysaccharide transport periplasmic protein LptA [Luminiphilus sp.]